jgi:hypothetical protein
LIKEPQANRASAEAEGNGLRGGFDRRLELEFDGSKIAPYGGLLTFRVLGDLVGLFDLG